MTKIICVESCLECPHQNPWMYSYWCEKAKKELAEYKSKLVTIPSWCPLPDKGGDGDG